MKIIIKYFLTLFLFAIFNITLLANDGAFYGRGNQLIPFVETKISVQKEILFLKKINNDIIEVTVYYEFNNPGPEKNIIVGFEALTPMGDVDQVPKNGLHPYMYDFTVSVNNEILKYNIAYVNDSVYFQNGIIKSRKLEDVINEVEEQEIIYDFNYVYYFEAKFKAGLNIIKHSYCYKLSNSIANNYSFSYILTAANRWANKQIDDFTLIIDLGEFETVNIDKDFFNNSSEWLINGIGKSEDVKGIKNTLIENDAVKFHIQKGNLIFQKKNFKPNGELHLYSQHCLDIANLEYVPFSYYQHEWINEPQNDFEKKILKNLPFARRGYIFQNPELKKYFENIDWYIPNPNYIPDIETLSKIEKDWIKNKLNNLQKVNE